MAAADALHVTPRTISQQIRVLEDFLGILLFGRENTGLRPTPLCELYHSHVSRGFECFHDAQAALNAQTGRRLTLMTFPSVATHWLASRLDKWHAICPHVQVHVEVVDHETQIGARSADVRLTYGARPNDGTPYHVAFTDRVAPVCAPSLSQAEGPLAEPADILRYPLIHVEWGWANMSPPTWANWFHAAGVPLPEVLAPLPTPCPAWRSMRQFAGEAFRWGRASLPWMRSSGTISSRRSGSPCPCRSRTSFAGSRRWRTPLPRDSSSTG
ncbi:LysR substrate-binding domain-containing protein [Burkholderia ubonensis]|uniref:LysR substrate-binding domain-containing protein n=1 Tax=Burkholderia ubonensis TaxID=101571 RepID=UPI0012FC71DE